MRAVTARRPEQAAERLADLAVRLGPCCAEAVDVLEVAARLEAEGVNDTLAVERYGHRDVFALAERLYHDSMREPGPGPAPQPVWRSTGRHHLLRGVLFGLPGLLYAAVGHTATGPRATALITASLLVAWALSEGLSFLGYVRLGALDRPGAERMLRRCLGLALLVLIPAIWGAATALGLGPGPTAFAAGQATYLLAATVVLVTGGERALFAALLPGAAVGVLQLVEVPVTGRAGAIWNELVWGGVAATVAATLLLAIVRTRRSRRAKGPWLRGTELLRSLPHAAFGLCAGGLLTFGTAVAVAGTSGTGTVMALPLSLSMGAAEWLLFRYRRRSAELLQHASSLREFARRSRRTLLGLLALYLTLLTAIADGVAWAGRATGTFVATPVPFWTSVVLGGALFTALALRSCGITAPVLACCALTLIGEAAVLVAVPRTTPDAVQLTGCAVLFVVLLGCALRQLGRATRHR